MLVSAKARAASGRLATLLPLVIIAVVAAATRLSGLDLAEFKDDEGKVASLIVAFLRGGPLPLVGIISSVGVNNPPAFVYLMTIPIAISRDPVFITGFIACLGVASVLLAYQLCAETFDRRVAQVAALLFAAAPWAVVFSRRAQAQHVLPFFTVLLMLSVFRFVRGAGSRHFVLAVVFLNVIVQLHFAGLALVPVVLVAFLLGWRRLRPASVVLAGALSLLLWSPYLLFQLQHRGADIRAALRTAGGAAQLDPATLNAVVNMASRTAYFGTSLPSFDLLYTAEECLLYAGVALVVWRIWRRRLLAKEYVVLGLWLVVPPLFWMRHSMPLYPHYFLTVFPAQFIVMGLALSWAERQLGGERFRLGRWRAAGMAARAAGFCLVTALVATQTASLFVWLRQLDVGPTPPEYGAPLKYRQAVVDSLAALDAGSGRTAVILANTLDYRSALEYMANLRGVRERAIDDRDTVLAPAAGSAETLYLVSRPDLFAGQLLRRAFPERLRASVPHPAEGGSFEIYGLSGADRASLADRIGAKPLDRSLPNGMHLVGYAMQPNLKPGESTDFVLLWDVAGLPPKGEDYAIFTHLVDDQGRKWAQVDGLGYAPIEWQIGDLVATGARLALPKDAPAGRYWIDLGVYQRPSIARLPLRAADGSTSDHARIGPFRVISGDAPAAYAPANPVRAKFGEVAELTGFDLQAQDARPGGKLHLSLGWLALGTPEADYSVFVHLVDASGRLVAQSDGQPGLYPTSLWSTGESVRDDRDIDLPASLPAGDYRMAVGLYRFDTGERLPTNGGDQATLGTVVSIR